MNSTIPARLRHLLRYPIAPIVILLVVAFGWLVVTIAVSAFSAIAGGVLFWIGIVVVPCVVIGCFFWNARLRELPPPGPFISPKD